MSTIDAIRAKRRAGNSLTQAENDALVAHLDSLTDPEFEADTQAWHQSNQSPEHAALHAWHDQRDAWARDGYPEGQEPGPEPAFPAPSIPVAPIPEHLRAEAARIQALVNAAPELTAEQKVAHALEAEVLHEVRKLQVREEAKRRHKAAQQGPATPLDIASGDELANCADDTPTYRVQGLMLHEGSTLITAQRKVGKTTFMVNLARSLLTGERFLGEFDVDQVEGSVALLNYEVSRGQFGTWARKGGVPGDRFHVVTLRGTRNPLAHPEERARLAELLKERGVEVLMVDPFANSFTGDNQNDAGQVASFLHELSVFTREEVGATDLILTNHAGWNAERTRGSSALEDWGDSLVKLVQGEDRLRYLSALGRDVDVPEGQLEFDPETLHLTLNREGSRVMAKQNEAVGALVDAVVAVAYDSPGLGTRGIQEALKDRGVTFSKAALTPAIAIAIGRGLVELKVEGQRKALYPPAKALEGPDTDASKGVGQV